MSDVDGTVAWLRRIIGLTLVVLIFSSRPLWQSGGEFPQIPWFAALTGLPGWVDAALLAVVGLSTLITLGTPRARWTTRLQWLALAALVSLDQQRLQPWMYQFLLLLGVLALTNGTTALRCCRAIVMSIYLWSGLSKCDPGFIQGHGQMLLDGLLGSVGLADRMWTLANRELAAAAMPAAEILIALLLSFLRTRRWGVVASLVMHITLILALGPRGLDHESGVLIWNAFFLIQNVLLFRRNEGEFAPDEHRQPNRGSRIAVAATLAAMLAPILNPFGDWDNWPSWSVYSAHPAIVELYVQDRNVARLPSTLQPLVDPPEPLQDWRRVRLDQWAFQQRHVPPYPQARWKLALALSVLEQSHLTGAARIVIRERRGWWTPSRTDREWPAEDAANSFWINLSPRYPNR